MIKIGVRIITDKEIFGSELSRPVKVTKRSSPFPENTYADFNQGGWIVHLDYGIGKYKGLVQRKLDNKEKEYICLEYDKGSQLFVPVYQADRLMKYVGANSNPPSISSLGTQEWIKSKKRVQHAVKEIANDLLVLYSKRQVSKGFAFSPDNQWQFDLEASFPFYETEDQLKAIREIKADMENNRPMDRLICGDVGYGKTELAIRASFKAVMDNKQVAIMVPTTVLAQQHYDTFVQRLKAFPVEIEMFVPVSFGQRTEKNNKENRKRKY